MKISVQGVLGAIQYFSRTYVVFAAVHMSFKLYALIIFFGVSIRKNNSMKKKNLITLVKSFK